ncbi:MAG: hypothetical protein RLZZ501_2739 [Pseudomonadota bacterium]
MTLRVESLSLGYGATPVLRGLDGAFAPAALTAVVGPNGAGKSTLLKGLAGLLPPLAGRVVADGTVAYLPQQAEFDPGFPLTVLDLVLLGHWRRIGAFAAIGRDHRAAAERALAAVGLAGAEQRLIGALSLGQRQRARFARLMIEDGAVILLDEPFAAIDAATTTDLMAILHRWAAAGRTVIAVSHDLDLVRRAFPHTLRLGGDTIAWGATATVLPRREAADV